MNVLGFPEDLELNPLDIDGFAFVKDFRVPKSGVSINQETITLVNEAYKRLEDWRKLEYGRFENPPAKVVSDTGQVYDYFLDLKPMVRRRNTIDVGLTSRKGQKHFFDNADFLLFDLINEENGLDPIYEVDVPYLIIPDNVEIQRAIALVTEASLLYQLYMTLLQIEQTLATLFDPTFVLAAALQLAALLVFLGLTIAALIQATIDLKEVYYPTLRNFKSTSDFDLIRQGCEHLGYTLESSVLENELQHQYTLGVPLAIKGRSILNYFQNQQTQYFNEAFPTDQDSTPTLGSLIDWYLKQYNLRIFVYDGVVKIERRLFFSQNASWTLVPTNTDQDESEDSFVFNEPDVWGRSYQHWSVDYSDVHSPDINDGMKSEHITKPITSLNSDLVRLTGSKQVSAPFSLGKRKQGLDQIELTVNLLINTFNLLVTSIGGNALPNNVNERNGALIIEAQYFSNTKKLYGIPVNGVLKQSSDYLDKLSMDYIYENFRKDLEVDVNSFIVKEMFVPFTDEMFIQLLQNNYVIYEPTDTAVEVARVEWFDRMKGANIMVLLPDDSKKNTHTIKLA